MQTSLSLPDWKSDIPDFNEELYRTPLSYILPFFEGDVEKAEKIIGLAVTFGCQPVERPVPRDGKDKIETMESLIEFLRNFYTSLVLKSK